MNPVMNISYDINFDSDGVSLSWLSFLLSLSPEDQVGFTLISKSMISFYSL